MDMEERRKEMMQWRAERTEGEYKGRRIKIA
jgi:hypothetical protein